MNRQTIPIHEITITERQRIDLGDITSLAESIKRFGLIQPIIITQDRRLIAGGRRIAAALSQGWTHIDVCYKETLTEADLFSMELEENVQRLEMAWQERCLNIAKIHDSRLRQALTDGDTWTQRKTAELLNVPSVSNINDAIRVARMLKSELGEDNKPKDDARIWPLENMSAAIQLLLRDRLQELEAANRAETFALANSGLGEVAELAQAVEINLIAQAPDLLNYERTKYYSNPLNPAGSFEAYWSEKQQFADEVKNTIYISNRLIHGDSISYMHDNPGRYDHVVTDIPYGIDMKHLQQQQSIADLDTVEELHDVQYNLRLIRDFFPAAFHCTKDNAFVITWCDAMLWQFMYDTAIRAGFKVQRWPITWYKQSDCKNECIQYNTTKDTEIAIVCRKPSATIAGRKSTSVISCGHDELSNSIRHPFAKPFACWEFLVDLASIEGQSILEPFAGGGSGVISMIRMKRNVIGVELDSGHHAELLENVKNEYRKDNPNYIFK